MATEIVLKFTGGLAPDNQITARTLSHSLMSLQRAVDKAVMFEVRGTVRKYSALETERFPEADLIVLPFRDGSVRIPLRGLGLSDLLSHAAVRIREVVSAPYEAAAEDNALEVPRLIQQVPAAINRTRHLDPDKHRQERLIANPRVERDYVEAAILSDIDGMLSPVRSSAATDEDTIGISIRAAGRSREFEFDKELSKRFRKVVREPRLGPETLYTGILKGLVEANSGTFPYTGKFVSQETEKEMKLLIAREEDALALNDRNLGKRAFAFWAAPLSIYGAFDHVRGDIVFLRLA